MSDSGSTISSLRLQFEWPTGKCGTAAPTRSSARNCLADPPWSLLLRWILGISEGMEAALRLKTRQHGWTSRLVRETSQLLQIKGD